MNAAVELGKNSVSTRFSLSMEMSRLTRDETAESVSRDQILRRERGQGNIHFPCSADQEQDWQPYPVDPYSCCMCVTMNNMNRYITLTVPLRIQPRSQDTWTQTKSNRNTFGEKQRKQTDDNGVTHIRI